MSIVRAEDNEALHLYTLSVAIGVAVVHFLSGIALLVNNGGLRTTPLFFLATFFHYNAIPVAGIFIGTALLAIAPFLVRSPSRALFMICVAPQQFLLLLHFASATTTVLIGQYPGTDISRKAGRISSSLIKYGC